MSLRFKPLSWCLCALLSASALPYGKGSALWLSSFHSNGGEKLQKLKHGGAGEYGLRTSFDIQLILGLPYYQHNLAPFVAEPFQLSLKSAGKETASETVGATPTLDVRHPICRVYEWRQRLAVEKGLTKLQIGEQEGLSNARITQLFSLLKLPNEAQEYLAALTAPSRIKAFSVRQLRGLVRLSGDDRLEAFRRMKADCERHS